MLRSKQLKPLRERKPLYQGKSSWACVLDLWHRWRITDDNNRLSLSIRPHLSLSIWHPIHKTKNKRNANQDKLRPKGKRMQVKRPDQYKRCYLPLESSIIGRSSFFYRERAILLGFRNCRSGGYLKLIVSVTYRFGSRPHLKKTAAT